MLKELSENSNKLRLYLDEEAQNDLKYLKKSLHKPTEDVIQMALNYYLKLKRGANNIHLA